MRETAGANAASADALWPVKYGGGLRINKSLLSVLLYD